ncbi:MAG TPA: GNAT family N-acetyltransferase [Terriglobales bacterium]|nr:GNAT family N-acetyltransferase [Terriglobales bacterium]
MPLTALSPDDPRWTDLVAAAGADMFYEPAFARFRTAGSPHKPLMLCYEDALGTVFDVTVAKSIASLPFFELVRTELPASLVDVASPEYNGPVVLGGDRKELIARYRSAVEEYLRDISAVTEFVRLHPLNRAKPELAAHVPLHEASQIVYVDLRGGYEKAWKEYRKGHRSTIKKAKSQGVAVTFVPSDADHLAEFVALYDSTMERRHGKQVYPAEFFSSLFQHLGQRALLVESRLHDRLAVSAVFLAGRKHLWYYFAGSDEELIKSGASTYMVDWVIRWAAERGIEFVMLGGGFEPGDSLYTSKRGFSHLMTGVNHIRRVCSPEHLLALQNAKAEYDRAHGRQTRLDYFPSYWLA